MLLDSNVLIYASKPPGQACRDFIGRHIPSVSAISVVEVLGFPGLPDAEYRRLLSTLRIARILPVSNKVIGTAVALRQARRTSLGDAIIAATALRHGLPLATHNTADFRWIGGLRLVNPLATTP